MLTYEHERTKKIVSRLISASSMIRSLMMLIWVVFFTPLLGLGGYLLGSEYWWIGGLVGALLGSIAGTASGALATAVLEWMAQMLVAQGEMTAALKNLAPKRSA